MKKRQSKYTNLDLALSSPPAIGFNCEPIHSLWLVLNQINDPRSAQGKRHPLPVILTLTILAICCGQSSFEAIQDWARNYQEVISGHLPFLAGHTPDASTFHRVFVRLDVLEFERVISTWLRKIIRLKKHEGIALDGKTVKNTKLHLVAAFAHVARAVLFQRGTTRKGKELVVGPEVLEEISLKDKITTGDAIFTQKKICKRIAERGGGYVFTVKDNQKFLKESIELYFRDPPYNAEFTEVTTVDRHKGRYEKRTVKAANNQELNKYLQDLGWTGVTHTWCCHRKIKKNGETSVEVAYGIARLFSGQTVEDLTSLIRNHWSIENNLHWERDVMFNEDKSAIRKGNAPQIMAALKNLVISVFNLLKVGCFAKAFRRFTARPEELFAFWGLEVYV